MTSNIINKTPFLREQRYFSTEVTDLAIEMDITYVDIATSVNQRIIGTFPTNHQAVTGERWFLQGQPQQTLRQVYTFTSTSNIPHGLNLSAIQTMTRMYGNFTDGTNYYGLINGTSTGITDQIVFYLTPTNIVFVSSGSPPSLSSGIIVLEWLSNI